MAESDETWGELEKKLEQLHKKWHQQENFPQKIEIKLVVSGLEEKGKIGIKVTPGSSLMKILENLLGGKTIIDKPL